MSVQSTKQKTSRAAMLFLLVFAAALGRVRGARAESSGPEAPTRLVLIVANNRGSELGRSELHYADDDGAKYRALFRTASTPSDVQLLTRFDRDTSRLFSEPPDALPTREALEQRAKTLIARSAELRRAGREVDFVFVYAGHGDVDRGKGFVQLEDGAFTADDLADLVRRVAATRAHVILDSCNSLFIVSPRKPGGRHVATSEDAVRALRERMPNVGVFLSTSADGEVFEWSELGAGIFSHAVRSGIAGAADANGDGRVTYAELRAFVDVATREVRNPRYRPKVFARGPAGDDQAAIYVPRASTGRKLVVEGPLRTTLRDADDVPWIDAHVEPGARIELVLPAPLDDGRATQVVLDISGATPRVVRTEVIGVERAEAETPAHGLPEPVAARGVNEIFRTLFVRPFGPRAMAASSGADVLVQEPYGVSHDDATRFSTLLHQVAETERNRRLVGGAATLGAGLVAGAVGAVTFASNDTPQGVGIGLGYMTAGLGAALLSPLVAFRPGPGEKLRADYERAIASGMSPASAIARAEGRLDALARAERLSRIVSVVGMGSVAALQGTLLTLNELRPDPDPQLRAVLGTTLMMSTALGIARLQPTPTERLAEIWRSEPSRSASRWTLSPVGPGGLGLSMTGRF